MKRKLTNEQVVQLLKKRQGDRTQKKLAEELGISQQFLSDIYAGFREPGDKLLAQLGLVKRTIYEEAVNQ